MKPSLLLVDDNEEILEFLEEELSEKYSLLKAGNGVEALPALKQEAIHLVVSDVMMPEMDGFELCRIMKSDVEFHTFPSFC
jgi:CheY-like chemotaxis protein